MALEIAFEDGVSYSSPSLVTQAIPFFFASIFIEIFIQMCSQSKYSVRQSDGSYEDAVNRPLYRLNDMISSISAGFMQQLVGKLVVNMMNMFVFCYIYHYYRFMTLPTSGWLIHLMALLGADFSYYWLHRFTHVCALGWSGHVVHHSSEEYNLSTALRQGSLQAFFNPLFNTWMALLGFHPSLYMLHYQINTIYQFWIHTRAIGTLGLLEWFLNTPSHHRVHHGRNPRALDKNYGGVFIIFDRIFGTFEPETPGEAMAYGLVHPLETFNPVVVQWHYFIHIFYEFFRIEDIKRKFAVLFCGPDFNPDDPEHPYEAPQINAHDVKPYDPQQNIWWKFYAIVQFTVLLVSGISFLVSSSSSVSIIFSRTLFLVLGLTCVSFVTDACLGSSHGRVYLCIEIVRLFSLVIFPWLMCNDGFEFIRAFGLLSLSSLHILWYSPSAKQL